MKERFKNPHPVDMSDYLMGLNYVIGGRDFDKEDRGADKEKKDSQLQPTYKLDWSFLTKKSRKAERRL